MSMRGLTVTAALALLAGGFLIGCGEKVDENRPVGEIQQEAEKLDAAALQKKIDAYKAAIATKEAELKKAIDEMKKIPLGEIASEKSKELAANVDRLTKSLDNLKDGLTAYVEALNSQKQSTTIIE